MATHKSALKKVRKDRRRRARNRAHGARLRTAVKKIRSRLSDGDADGAREMLPATLALLDRSAKLGVLPDRTASRTKSRITRALNKLSS